MQLSMVRKGAKLCNSSVHRPRVHRTVAALGRSCSSHQTDSTKQQLASLACSVTLAGALVALSPSPAISGTIYPHSRYGEETSTQTRHVHGFSQPPSPHHEGITLASLSTGPTLTGAPSGSSSIERSGFARGIISSDWNPFSVVGLVALNALGFYGAVRLVKFLQDESEPVTVAKIQVGLCTRSGDLQRRLQQLQAMMSMGQQGTWLILEEAVLEVLRYKSQCRYGSSSVQYLSSKSKGYELFKKLATEEAVKNEEEEEKIMRMEEQNAVGAPKKQLRGGMLQTLFSRDSDQEGEAIVLTLVVAARGQLDIPEVQSWQDLRHGLQQLCGLSSAKVMAVELLWTPQLGEEHLTTAQMLDDFPNLVALSR